MPDRYNIKYIDSSGDDNAEYRIDMAIHEKSSDPCFTFDLVSSDITGSHAVCTNITVEAAYELADKLIEFAQKQEEISNKRTLPKRPRNVHRNYLAMSDQKLILAIAALRTNNPWYDAVRRVEERKEKVEDHLDYAEKVAKYRGLEV